MAREHETLMALDQRLALSEDARVFAQSVLETVRQAILVLDGDLRVAYANRWFCDTFHVTRAETEGQLVYRLGNEQWDIPDLRRLLERVIPTGEAFEEFAVRHRFDTIGERLMCLNARRICRDDGRGSLILLAIEDLTEREAAQRALDESERQYRTLVESINSIIIRADVHGNITFINRFAEWLFGIARDEWLGKPLFGNVIPCIEGDCSETLQRILADPARYYINESRIRRPDGTTVFFSWSAKGLRDEAGRVTELLIDGNDMSPLADYRRRLADALHLLDASSDPTALVDAEERPMFVNAAFERHVAPGTPPLPLSQLAAESPVAAELSQWVRRARQSGGELLQEMAVNGRRLQWHVVPTESESCGPDSVMLFARDVTELDAARGEAERISEALRERNLELDAFNYSVSHDLRGPLRALTGFSAILDEDYAAQLHPEARGYLQRIGESARKMSALVDGLLTLSRVGREEPAREPLDLSAMARAILAELAEEYPERRVRVSVEPELAADADRRLLQIVLTNLLGNAWKYTGHTPEPTIAFARCDTSRGPAFVVRDNGAGFEPQLAAQLFEPFRRAHSGQEFAGSGIGLATVARAVHSHGGQTWAEGEPGAGAAFYFTLGA